MVLALLSALVTFLVLTGLTAIVPTHEVVVSVLLANATMVAVLLGIVAWGFFDIVRARRKGRAGARLHVRIALMFGLVSAVPAILVAIIASITLERGLDRWFSTRTREIINSSSSIAQTYVREHAFGIRADATAMADDLSRLRSMHDENLTHFREILTAQASIRGLPVTLMIHGNASVMERADIDVSKQAQVPGNLAVTHATIDRPIIYFSDNADFVAAIVPIQNFDDAYLYVARPIDPKMLQYLSSTQAAVAEYSSMEDRRFGVQVAFALMYAVIALILLLSSVWLGLNFANWLVAPIRRLIGAADLVASGNLDVKVPLRRNEGDLANLSESFNKMTQELRSQHEDLVGARDQIDQRRRFTEAVLSGVGSGVIGLDTKGRVTIINRSAERLLNQSGADFIGAAIGEQILEIAPLVEKALAGEERVNGTIKLMRGGRERTINVRVTTESSPESEHGYVVTLDDITELVSAQRTSAWADVARRIAHEIKNPLTPIQLSAERLRRKYGKVLANDREIFEQCTQTIIRQVGDIGRMVDEFSTFARTPKPVVETQDLAETVRQVVFLMRVGHPEIHFEVELPPAPLQARFDRRLISQGLTNIIKNAVEAIEALPAAEGGKGKGRIIVHAAREGAFAVVDVVDNGIGLPRENRERLLEPYVTTREKGTGLGLAIVGKILEEHGGRIELRDAPAVDEGGHGAWIRLSFAIEGAPQNERAESKEEKQAQDNKQAFTA
ncbi:MAG TPA: PAS domain-containing sensor histidine kinase [Xanthobacteraceae bacterium]|nr:PAS domain-containing sensor histidine kinase [Xanthobacteraceae bacterium]